MNFRILAFISLLSTYALAFNISEAPKIKERQSPINSGAIYSYYDSIKEAKKAVVNISTQKKIKNQILGAFLDPHQAT